MKRLLFLLLLCASAAFGQGIERNASPVLSGNARPIAGAHVWVCTGVVGTSLPTEPPCTPAASIYANYYPTSPVAPPITQPIVTDGFGNYDYFGAAGVYTECITGTMISPGYCKVITLGGGSGSGTLTSFSAGNLPPIFTTSVSNPTTTPNLQFNLTNAPPLTVFGNASGSTGAPTYYQLPQTFTTSASETASLPNSRQWVNGTNTTVNLSTPGQIKIDATGGGGSCATGLSDLWVLSVHPAATCYGSANFTWDDGASKQNLQAGLSNTVGVSQTFLLGQSNTASGSTDVVALGASNSMSTASGSELFALGINNSVSGNPGGAWFVGASNNIGGNDCIIGGFANNLPSSLHLSTYGAVPTSCGAFGQANNIWFSNTGVLGGNPTDIWFVGEGNRVTEAGTQASGAISSVHVLGDSNMVGDTLNHTSEVDITGTGNVVDGAATTLQILGYQNTASNVSEGGIDTTIVGSKNTLTNVAPTNYAFAAGHHLTLSNCDDCYAFGRNVTVSTNNYLGLGLSATPEIAITPGQVKFNAPLVMDPSYIQNVAEAFSSLPVCNSGQTGTSATVNDSTTNQFGATVTGSGTNKVGVYCNGTNWTVSAGGATGGTGTVTTTGSPLSTYLAGFSGATSITGTSAATLDASGNLVANNLTASALTVGNCVQTTTGGLLTTAAGPCGVTSGTLTTTGSPVSGNLTKFSGTTSVTNGDLSGDVTTSGTLAATVVNLRSLPLPTLAASTGFLYDNAGTLSLSASASNLTTGTLPCAQEPARTGDTTSPSGSCVNTTVKINGGSMPASATVLGSNSSSQPIAATLQGNGAKVQLSTGTTTTNDCVKYDVSGNAVDSGAACGGTGTVSSIATTAPITGGPITTTGTIACATCVVASAPGAGVAHFAGSTQTVTSSPVSLTSDISGILPAANGGTGQNSSTSTGVAQVSGGAWSVSTSLANGTKATTQSPLDNSTNVSTTAYADAAVAAANPMNAVGQRIGGGASGAPTQIAAGLTGQVDTATNGSTGGFASPGVGGRTVSTSTGDTILGDSGTALRDRGTTILYTSSSPETVTLPQAGSTGFSSNFVASLFQLGAGLQTITPTTSTINGQMTLPMGQNVWCSPSSPDNTNYIARCATFIKAGTGLTPTYNADGSTTLTADASSINSVDYDCNFGGGITAEGLVGSCGWYSDLAGAGSAGSISRSAAAAPDVNHFALLDMASGTASGDETGTGWGYCNVTTPTTACGVGTQANEIFPHLDSMKFQSYFVFKNPAVLTSVRLCAVYQSLSFLTHTCDQSDGPDQTIGVQFSTSAGDTHWMAVTGDATGGGGAHNTRTDTGVTPVAGDYTCIYIFSTTIGTIQFEVGDSATSACSSLSSPVSITTTMPTSSESPWMLVTPLNTTAKHMYPIRWKFHAVVAP